MDCESVKLVGGHWQQIGYQATDPLTDIRGAGMLGCLHMLDFVFRLPKTAKFVHAYSRRPECEFPLAVKMFEFTSITLRLFKQGKLTALCNRMRNCIDAVSQTMIDLFLKFFEIYLKEKANILTLQVCAKQVENSAQSGKIQCMH